MQQNTAWGEVYFLFMRICFPLIARSSLHAPTGTAFALNERKQAGGLKSQADFKMDLFLLELNAILLT